MLAAFQCWQAYGATLGPSRGQVEDKFGHALSRLGWISTQSRLCSGIAPLLEERGEDRRSGFYERCYKESVPACGRKHRR